MELEEEPSQGRRRLLLCCHLGNPLSDDDSLNSFREIQ